MKTQTQYTCAEGTALVYAHPDGIKNEADIIRCIRSGDVPVAVSPELLYELEIASKTSMKERIDRKSTRLNSSHCSRSRMPSSA